jgi:outer membrane protein OmpA-like peptidoglycan-associated protein
MAYNLVESVRTLFNDELIRKAATSLGETPTGIRKAVDGIIPSVLTGLLNKASSGTTDAAVLLTTAKEAAGSGLLGKLNGLLGGRTDMGVTRLLRASNNLFDDKLSGLSNLISNFAGIKPSSASSLLNLAAPAALGVVGKHASDKDLNTSGFLTFLANQKDNVLNAIPSGLGKGLAGLFGLSNLGAIGSKLSNTLSGIAGGARQAVATAADSARRRTTWLLPLILVLTLIFAIWYFMRSGNSPAATGITYDTTTLGLAPGIDSQVIVRESLKVRLPDNTELDVYRGGIEDKLVIFLNDPNSVAGKDQWFDFDNLNFETGSARITPESMTQVRNIVSILKAYPKMKIKIGGYTDKTGNETVNMKLSQDRADAVVVALKEVGANPSQLVGAEGYGSQFAKVPADASEEDRRSDRRIAVSVRGK